MASEGDDDRRGKRKMIEPQDKQMPHRGRGRTIGGSSSAAGYQRQGEEYRISGWPRGRDENGMNIFRPYSKPNPFRGG